MSLKYWRVFRHEVWHQLRQIGSNRYYLFALLVQPLLMATTLYYLSVQSDRPNLLPYITIGPGVLAFLTAAIFISGSDLIREREAGVLPYLIGAPTPIAVVLAGKITADQLASLASFFITFAYATFLSGESFPVQRMPMLILALVCLNLSLLGLGLMMSGCLMLFESARGVQNLLSVPLIIFSGIYFPVSRLWGPYAWPSRLLSVWWGAEALRATLGPEVTGSFWVNIGGCLLLGVGYLVIGIYFLRLIEYRTRVQGQLEIGG